MVTIRTDKGIMICKLEGRAEQELRASIALGLIPTRPATLKPDSKHWAAFIVSDDMKYLVGGATIYLYTGTQLLLDASLTDQVIGGVKKFYAKAKGCML